MDRGPPHPHLLLRVAPLQHLNIELQDSRDLLLHLDVVGSWNATRQQIQRALSFRATLTRDATRVTAGHFLNAISALGKAASAARRGFGGSWRCLLSMSSAEEVGGSSE